MATRFLFLAALMAHFCPAGPEPITIKSKCASDGGVLPLYCFGMGQPRPPPGSGETGLGVIIVGSGGEELADVLTMHPLASQAAEGFTVEAVEAVLLLLLLLCRETVVQYRRAWTPHLLLCVRERRPNERCTAERCITSAAGCSIEEGKRDMKTERKDGESVK